MYDEELIIQPSWTLNHHRTPNPSVGSLHLHADADDAAVFIRQVPGFSETPLLSLERLGPGGKIYYKDESSRFGVGSFKALGAIYGLAKALQTRHHLQNLTETVRISSLSRFAEVEVVCATDGNYGRAVAWAATLFNCRCHIFASNAISRERVRAIERYGAKLTVVDGTYEAALSIADVYARCRNRLLVSDTAYDECIEIPRHVMCGYALLVDELLSQMGHAELPTHVFLQVGVGGLAASIIERFLALLGTSAPRFILVEPVAADCAYQSIRSGQLRDAIGDLNTMAGGLACGRLSSIAWPIIQRSVSGAITVTDREIAATVRLLASRCGVSSGESGCVGLAGYLSICEIRSALQSFQIDSTSRLLMIGTEGPVDKAIFDNILTSDRINACGI